MYITKKVRLLDALKRNYALVMGDEEADFVCPLCLQHYSTEHNAVITGAHIWPESLGGREETLACKRCNNRMGSEIESYEKRRVDYLRADEINVIFSVPGVGDSRGKLRVEQSEDELISTYVTDPRRTNPKDEKALKVWFENGAGEATLTEENEYSRRWERANLAYLHCAYMHLFHHFGYWWVFSRNAERVRQQLFHPDEEIYERVMINLSGPILSHLPSDGRTYGVFVREPLPWRGVVVVAPPLSYPEARRTGIWLSTTQSDGRHPGTESVSFGHHRLLPPLHQYLARLTSFTSGDVDVVAELRSN